MGSLYDDWVAARDLNPTPAFVTGSHIYGSPKPESDVDLVVLCSQKTKEKLLELSGGKYPIRFGNLNIIAAGSEEEYKAWYKAKTKCVEFSRDKGRPLTKEESIIVHDMVRVEYGVEYAGGSGKRHAE